MDLTLEPSERTKRTLMLHAHIYRTDHHASSLINSSLYGKKCLCHDQLLIPYAAARLLGLTDQQIRRGCTYHNMSHWELPPLKLEYFIYCSLFHFKEVERILQSRLVSDVTAIVLQYLHAYYLRPPQHLILPAPPVLAE